MAVIEKSRIKRIYIICLIVLLLSIIVYLIYRVQTNSISSDKPSRDIIAREIIMIVIPLFYGCIATLFIYVFAIVIAEFWEAINRQLFSKEPVKRDKHKVQKNTRILGICFSVGMIGFVCIYGYEMTGQI